MMMEWLPPELWMIINLGSLVFILILALLSYKKEDPSIELLTKVLLVLVRLERIRISQDQEGLGTDKKDPSSSMVENPTGTFKPSQAGVELLKDLEEKLEGLL